MTAGIYHYAWFMRVLWGLGYADQAQQRCQEVLALAQQVGHTSSLVLAEYFAARARPVPPRRGSHVC